MNGPIPFPGSTPVTLLEPSEVFTVDELAAILKTKRGEIYRQVQSGNFPHFRVGNRLRFLGSEINLWINHNMGGVL